jgi:hypothetical protein
MTFQRGTGDKENDGGANLTKMYLPYNNNMRMKINTFKFFSGIIQMVCSGGHQSELPLERHRESKALPKLKQVQTQGDDGVRVRPSPCTERERRKKTASLLFLLWGKEEDHGFRCLTKHRASVVPFMG